MFAEVSCLKTVFSILDYADYNTRVISDLLACNSVIYHRRYGKGKSSCSKLAYKMLFLPERYFGPWYAGIELALLFGKTIEQDCICPVLLVYECNYLALNSKLLQGMKRKCPQLKLVLILTNIVGAIGSPKSHLEEQKKVFDFIVTFSEDDAKRYDLVHYEGMYSRINITGLRASDDDYSYDLYYCGRDKGRTATLLSIAEILSRKQVSYRFDIIGGIGPKLDGFSYLREPVRNDEMLRRASMAKTVLEIMADPTNKGSSLRPYEAYALNMKLLSNNRYLVEKPWYNPKQIAVFDDVQSIDIDFIRTPLKPEDVQDLSVLSPIHFLEFVAKELNVPFEEI